jgi:hypothetical protein
LFLGQEFGHRPRQPDRLRILNGEGRKILTPQQEPRIGGRYEVGGHCISGKEEGKIESGTRRPVLRAASPACTPFFGGNFGRLEGCIEHARHFFGCSFAIPETSIALLKNSFAVPERSIAILNNSFAIRERSIAIPGNWSDIPESFIAILGIWFAFREGVVLFRSEDRTIIFSS